MKEHLTRCCICTARITDTEKIIKVKERMLYRDSDGIWSNFKTSCICSNCLAEICKKVKGGV